MMLVLACWCVVLVSSKQSKYSIYQADPKKPTTFGTVEGELIVLPDEAATVAELRQKINRLEAENKALKGSAREGKGRWVVTPDHELKTLLTEAEYDR